MPLLLAHCAHLLDCPLVVLHIVFSSTAGALRCGRGGKPSGILLCLLLTDVVFRLALAFHEVH